MLDSTDGLYCKHLYNFQLKTNSNIENNETRDSEPAELLVLQEEVKRAVHSLKGGKSPGVDSVPAELLKQGEEETPKTPTVLCQRVWECKEWLQSLIIPLLKKGNSK